MAIVPRPRCILRLRVVKELARLTKGNARILVATSGGPDSQALLHALADHKIIAAGIDHGLRAQAARELDVAEALAKELGIPFVRRSVTLTPGNVMQQARKARYDALRSIAREHGAKYIAVAHTATDQLEQAVLDLVRNNGTRGLTGIPEKRGMIVRPLLTTTRAQVLAYLEKNAIPYATDPSNADTKRSRARVRHDVLPVLRALNPRIDERIATWSTQRRTDERFLDRAAHRLLEKHRNAHPVPKFVEAPPHIAITALRGPLGRRVLTAWLETIALVPRRRLVERLMTLVSRIPGSIRASEGMFAHDGTTLWHTPAPGDFALELSVPGDVRIAQSRMTATLGDPPAELRVADAVAFDARDLQIPLVVRAWRNGDAFRPFNKGLAGHTVKVSDLFINAKVPRALRSVWPVVTCGDDIVWVVGLRRSNAAPITSETQRAVTLAVET